MSAGCRIVGLDRHARPRAAKRPSSRAASARTAACRAVDGHCAAPASRGPAATSSARGTSICAGWSFHSSWLALSAIFAPRIRSLICTTPRAASSAALDDRDRASRACRRTSAGCRSSSGCRGRPRPGCPPARSSRDHRLVVGHPVAVHHGHDHRPRAPRPDPPLGAQRGQQPVDADGDAGRRHRLPGEALDQIVVAPAAATEPNCRGRPFSSRISKVSSASKTGPV